MRGPRNIFCVSVYLMTVLFLNLILNKCNVKYAVSLIMMSLVFDVGLPD
jgi:hypothetical protein